MPEVRMSCVFRFLDTIWNPDISVHFSDITQKCRKFKNLSRFQTHSVQNMYVLLFTVWNPCWFGFQTLRGLQTYLLPGFITYHIDTETYFANGKILHCVMDRKLYFFLIFNFSLNIGQILLCMPVGPFNYTYFFWSGMGLFDQ